MPCSEYRASKIPALPEPIIHRHFFIYIEVIPLIIERYPTPLRYPGGKQRLGKFFSKLIFLNKLSLPKYVEPFCGGAGVALYLLQKSLVKSVHLNDIDRSIFAFWHSATKYNSELCNLIKNVELSVAEWDRQKEIQRAKKNAPLLELGFSTLYLNRTNRSGILRGGIIGGRDQAGAWTMDARFNVTGLLRRLELIGQLRRKISLSNEDVMRAEDLTFGAGQGALLYLDPPYFKKSHRLYQNNLSKCDHKRLAVRVVSLERCSWVVTYDDASAAIAAYKGQKMRRFSLSHTAGGYRLGRELMFLSDGMRVPRQIVGS